jgi:uncharacterized NAD-dependent epimerase/dehydratase family protein
MNLQTPYLLFLGNATDLLSVKIASSVVDWRPELCVGEFKLPGCTITKGLESLTLAEARDRGAKTFVITLNNNGGYIESDWIPSILKALEAGFDVASGLHERLTSIPEIVEKAASVGRQLVDVRHPAEKLGTGTGIRRAGKRLLTVGTDCSVGKMYASLALEKEMRARGLDASFVATGQCGIFVCGSGVAIDCVISDFISGAAEALSPGNDAEHWDIIEGQGSLSHASFAGVSLGLLHGSQPDALVLCHAENRDHMRGMPTYPLPGLQEAMDMNVRAAKLTNSDAQFVGVAVNTSMLSESESRAVLKRYEDETGLPCVDPFRTGVAAIVDRLAT